MDLVDFRDELLEAEGLSFDDLGQGDKWDHFLSSKISSAKYRGFKYRDPGPCDGGRDLVIASSGTKMTEARIHRRLRKLELGNEYQVEALKANEFLWLNRMYEHYGY